jgi:two-component system, NtrC family, response regulator
MGPVSPEDIMASILIIDDDRVFCDVLSRAISRIGHSSNFSLTLKGGLEEACSRPYDVVLLDVQLPDGNGLTAIEKFRKIQNPPEVIIITGCGSPDGAELAIRWGAWDYIEKPTSTDGIVLPVGRALEYRKEKLTKSGPIALNRKRIVGDSQALAACLDLIAHAARSDVNVLITGETGTGKELFARTLHENSARANQPFVVVDCGALPESLVENLLFGHQKGAFTGANETQTGLVKQADGGTLFLDEVGELPLPVQKAFLRVLQERSFRPIGSKKEETSDFRLIAASNRNLDELVESGIFRGDLLFRLRSLAVHLPALKERPEDILNLAMHYVARSCEKSRVMLKGFSPNFFDVLQTYEWPGNVRELFSTLQSALAVAHNEPILFPIHLPVPVRVMAARSSVGGKARLESGNGDVSKEDSHPLEYLTKFKEFRLTLLENSEKLYFTRLASVAAGNMKEACRISGLSRSRLYYFLQKYNISLFDHPTATLSSLENRE